MKGDTVTRGIMFPIAAMVPAETKLNEKSLAEGGPPWSAGAMRKGKADFTSTLKSRLALTYKAANAAMTSMLHFERPALQDKLPPFDFKRARSVASAMICQVMPDVPSSVYDTLSRAVVEVYSGLRKQVLIDHTRQFPTLNRGLPYTIRDGAFGSFRALGDGRVIFDIGLIGQKRDITHYDVLCKSGPGHERNLALLRRAIAGEIKIGDLRLDFSRKRSKKNMVEATICMHLPRLTDKPRDGVLTIHTDPQALLVADIGEQKVFILNEDKLRGLIWNMHHCHLCHKAGLRRGSQDFKAELRKSDREIKNRERWLDRHCGAHKRFIKDCLHKAAATVTGHADRRGVALVLYDDKDKSYMPGGFQWFMLASLIEQKLDAIGIAFKHVGKAKA